VPPRRLALLVATYRYQDAGLSQLTSPGHDAEALAEVLRNPEIANFDVTILINEPHHVVGNAIGEFYRNRRRDDLTLLYFTGHGLKDDQGHLYLAMTNTRRDDLLFTALSAYQIDSAMESCLSRQKVLVLDCCYSGAFPAGHLSKAGGQVNALEKFQGKGRVVLTASDATQYSFEGNHIIGEGTQSVFTRSLVKGLTTGEADLDGDGDISIGELYSYVHDHVIEEMPQQRPKKQENIEGNIVIARNIHWDLPVYVHNAIESPITRDRIAALEGLTHLHRVGNDLVRAEVINQIHRLIRDDSKTVAAAAMKLITTLNPEIARREAEEQTRQVEEQAQHEEHSWREAEEQDQRQVEEQARQEEQFWREAQKQATHKADRWTAPAWLLSVLADGGRRRQVLIGTGAAVALAGVIILAIFVGMNDTQTFPPSGSTPPSTLAPTAAATIGPEVAIPAVGTTIAVGKTPAFVASSPNGRHVYIANRDAQALTVVDTAINQLTATVPIKAGPPQFLAFTPDGRTLYVSIFNDQQTIHMIDVIDTSSNTVTATIPQPARPFLPAVTPDGKRLFVPNHDVAAVSVVATDTNTIIAQIKVAPDPHWVAFSRDGSRAYTANHESNLVSVIDTATLKVVATIPVGTSPHSIAVNPHRPLVASANYDGNSVSEIDTNTLKVVATIPVGKNPRDISWAPDGRFAYVVNEDSNTVSVIDAATNQVTANIPTGGSPISIAVLPNGRQAYVSNLDSGTVTVLELTG
jgi:YVTN family beta-propeller protein